MTEEEVFELIFGKTNESVRAKMTYDERIQSCEKDMEYFDSVRKECTAKIASLREELVLLNQTQGKYRNKFLSMITNKTRYAKVKQELVEQEDLCTLAEFSYQICAENLREELRDKWLHTPSKPDTNPVKEATTADWDDSASESASDTDCSSNDEEENINDEVSVIDDSVRSGNSNYEISMFEEVDDFSSTMQAPQEPSISMEQEQLLIAMEERARRLAAMYFSK